MSTKQDAEETRQRRIDDALELLIADHKVFAQAMNADTEAAGRLSYLLRIFYYMDIDKVKVSDIKTLMDILGDLALEWAEQEADKQEGM